MSKAADILKGLDMALEIAIPFVKTIVECRKRVADVVAAGGDVPDELLKEADAASEAARAEFREIVERLARKDGDENPPTQPAPDVM